MDYYKQVSRKHKSTVKEMAIEMETGNRLWSGEQQTDMESFYGKQTSKDKSLKENDNKKTHNVEKNGTKIIHGQIISTTDCRRNNCQAK